MLLRNAWYIAAWADEIGGEPLARRICDEPIVMFHDQTGRVAALADRCCHRAAPLHMGAVVEDGIQCGYHGLVFDGAGRCVRIPGQKQIPADASVRSYPAVEKDQLVWVWTGDPAKADAARIVDFPYHNDPGRWPNKHDVYPIKGNYMLMVDNLMDLTHLGYLHAKTVGGNPAAHVEAAGFTGRVDRWQEFEFVAPSSVLQWTGAADAGTGADQGKRDGGFQFRLFHGLTPETETSCFYFWSAANGYRQNDPAATEQLYQEIAPTFVEDRVMVEAQQARLDEFGETGLVEIASDATRMHMRRMVERLIAEERAALAAE